MLIAVAVAWLTAAVAKPLDVVDFSRGETLDYDLSWLGVVGGSMRMTIEGSGPERLHITSSAVSDPSLSRIYSVRDEIESFILRDSFSTLRYEKTLNENGKTKEDDTTIDPISRTATTPTGSKTKAFHSTPPA